jgi:selenocysteine lyase/cysteine desulfurase
MAKEVAYLNSAAEGLPFPECAEALQEYCAHRSRGTLGRKALFDAASQTIGLAADLLQAAPRDVMLLSSASEALCLLASSLHWRPADEVIITDLEFPSNVLPWLRLKRVGVRVLVIPSNGGVVQWQDIANQMSSRTRLVSVSLVSYKTGAYLAGLDSLATEVKRAGAFLCADATQALGRCPAPIRGIDYMVASSFKWLMAPHGVAIVYLSPALRESMDPASAGWYSVRNRLAPDRFERYELKAGAACLAPGMPNLPSIYGLRRSLNFLMHVGVDTIYAELAALVRDLRAGLVGLGCQLLTPAGPEYASGIVSFTHAAPEQMAAALEKEGIIVWAGDGRVRASVHLYNDEADVRRLLGGLESLMRYQKSPAAV